MLTLEVCVGSACHVKGSYNIISKLQELISENGLEDRLEVKAAFCFGRCAQAVSVQFEGEDKIFSVAPTSVSVSQFFDSEIRKRLND